MRWFNSIAFIVLLASCQSLKPVTGKQASTETQQPARSQSPRFIENITINDPAHSKREVTAAAPADKRTSVTTRESVNTIESLNALQFKYALLMDVSVEELNNIKLLQYIDEWYGTRYRFGGTNHTGIDCSAFSSGLMSEVFSVELPRMAKDQFNACQRLRREQLQEGDLVFFHTTRKGVSHVGVYLMNNKFVHASVNNGVTISDMSDGYYLKTFVGGGRAMSAERLLGGR